MKLLTYHFRAKLPTFPKKLELWRFCSSLMQFTAWSSRRGAFITPYPCSLRSNPCSPDGRNKPGRWPNTNVPRKVFKHRAIWNPRYKVQHDKMNIYCNAPLTEDVAWLLAAECTGWRCWLPCGFIYLLFIFLRMSLIYSDESTVSYLCSIAHAARIDVIVYRGINASSVFLFLTTRKATRTSRATSTVHTSYTDCGEGMVELRGWCVCLSVCLSV